jgi:dethiobiotin synthetase
MTGLFVAGTDTGRGLRVAAMKPVAAGALSTARGMRNEDAEALAAAANVAATYEQINPYCLAAPVSPHIAARDAGIDIDVALIARRFRELALRADCVIVEGAGGWLAPTSERETMADVARALALPVVLVIGLRLGCLNHALLSARAIEADGLTLAAWVGNRIDPAFERLDENLATLERRLGTAPLAVLPHLRRTALRAEGMSHLERGIALPERAVETLLALARTE